MVCSEMDWSIGPENHATTLMTFGCCEGAPIIMKQEQEPAGRTMQLSQLAGGGARRRLMSSGGMLGDKHSLSADYAQLLKDEKSMQKRVAKLAVSKMLPYRGQQLRVVRSRGGNDGELAGRARDNDRPHVDTPGEDDFGTERQYTSQEGRPDRTWSDHGRRCVGADCPRDDDEEFEDTLGSVTSRGTPARHNHPQQHRQHPAGSRGAMRRQPDAGLDTFENPAEEDPADMTPEEFAGWLEQTNAGYAGADLYVQYERCTRRRSKSQCLKQIEMSIERWEYTQRGRAMRGRRGRARGRARGGMVRTGSRGTGNANYEAVSRSVEATYGRDVGRGLASPDELSRGLLNGQSPTDRSVRQYLGRNLYRAYMTERRNRNMYGTAHRQLRKGIARVREAYTFQRAYNRSSYEHCLVMHKDDADFPRACMPLRDRIGRPWQSRNKDTTAPEDVLNGVMDGWWRFIGDDKHQLVGSVDDEAGVRHKNRFVEGEEPVPSKDYSTEDPAPWEKNRLVRDEPQHVEQKAMYAWDSAKLPGVLQ